jgi:gliding motility-associated-like protein
MTLTVNYPANNALTDTACKPYTWHDNIYNVSNTFYYSYTDANGCSCVDTLYLTYVDTTNTYITAGDFCNDFSAVLEVRSDFTDFTSFLWSTGETTSTITVYNEDTYTVTATQGSCSLERTYTIEPCEREILLPNAISPFSDNPDNRVFCIPEFYFGFMDDDNFSVYIYNRWGAVVFSSNSKYFQWDGTVNSKIYHEAIYNYVIYFRTKSGQQRKLTGSISVL